MLKLNYYSPLTLKHLTNPNNNTDNGFSCLGTMRLPSELNTSVVIRHQSDCFARKWYVESENSLPVTALVLFKSGESITGIQLLLFISPWVIHSLIYTIILSFFLSCLLSFINTVIQSSSSINISSRANKLLLSTFSFLILFFTVLFQCHMTWISYVCNEELSFRRLRCLFAS